MPDDWPQPIYGAYSQGHRGVRIDEAFDNKSVVDVAAAIRLQNDVKSSRAERLCPHILRHLATSSDEAATTLSRALKDWDYCYTLHSTAPTLFETFMVEWQRSVLAEHLPERLLDLTHQQTGLGATLLEDPGLSYFAAGTAATVAVVAQRTLAALRKRLGDDPASWQWGRLHQAHWRHPVGDGAFDIGPHEVDGGSHTVRNTGGEMPPHTASSGAEYRIVVDFADPDFVSCRAERRQLGRARHRPLPGPVLAMVAGYLSYRSS